jgi:hypothetical protein
MYERDKRKGRWKVKDEEMKEIIPCLILVVFSNSNE